MPPQFLAKAKPSLLFIALVRSCSGTLFCYYNDDFFKRGIQEIIVVLHK